MSKYGHTDPQSEPGRRPAMSASGFTSLSPLFALIPHPYLLLHLTFHNSLLSLNLTIISTHPLTTTTIIMFASIPSMQVMATIVESECESGVRLCAAPANLASPDLRQILSPRLTNTQNMEICSPTPGCSSFNRDLEIERLKREILVAHENARNEKKAANKARSELQRKEKELYAAQAQVLYLGQQGRGYEAELSVVKDQLSTVQGQLSIALVNVDLESIKIERDMYQEQEKEALAERDASRQNEQVALKKLAAERKARTKAEKECHAAFQHRIVTSKRRENFTALLNSVRRERDNIMERLYVSEQNLKKRDSENNVLKMHLRRLAPLLHKPAAIYQKQYDTALAFVQREHKTTLSRVQQEHKAALARVEREHTKALDMSRQTRRQERTIYEAVKARLTATEFSNGELRARLSAAEASYGELQQRLGNSEDLVFQLASMKATAEAKLQDALSHIWSMDETLPSESSLQTSPTYYEDLSSLAGPATGVGLGFSHLA